MAEEKTVIVDRDSRGSGSGWAIAIVLIVALLVGVYFLSGMAGSEASKNNAVSEAASQVGNAAKQVGDAAKDVTNPSK